MSSPGAGRRIQKRRRTTTKALSQLLDLNCPPAEGAEGGSPFSSLPVSHNEASSSMTVHLNQASSSIPPATNNEPNIGMHSCPIDVEAIDDDVVIYSSASLPQFQARQQLTRRVTVILVDDDSETNAEPAGDALHEHVNTLLSLGTNRRHEPPSATNTSPVISLVDTPEVNFKAPPEPVKEVPKEPKFTCPICMNELMEAASTVCGHIFCQKCIKAAIQAQKKCPTCRRTLNKNQHHRVYLPTTE